MRPGGPILAALLDGPSRRLRDDNHIAPHLILVLNQQQQPVIQALTILEYLGRYSSGDHEDVQWCADELLAILQRKRAPLRMNQMAHDIDDAEPTCGRSVLIINSNG